MKNFILRNCIVPSVVCMSLFSFSGKQKKTVYDRNFIEKNLCAIPGGSFLTGGDGKSQTYTIEPFQMFNQEVSNGFYLSYLQQLKSENETAYQQALPDTLVWRMPLAFNEKYVDYYLRHPAYSDFPVVGVTYAQCIRFCEWLTKQYNADPKRKFQQVVFTLPDSIQREYAAYGGLTHAIFPWEGQYMRNSKGLYMANFLKIDEAGIQRMTINQQTEQGIQKRDYLISTRITREFSGNLDDYADITVPVKSYFPNGYGLYNMAGNVEEFILGESKTMGGSWRDPGYYLQNSVTETHDPKKSASSERGFRFVMKVVK